MVHYKPVKVTIGISSLAEVILDMVVWHHDLSNLIVSNKGLLLPQNFGHHSTTFLASNRDSQLPSILKEMAKPSNKTA